MGGGRRQPSRLVYTCLHCPPLSTPPPYTPTPARPYPQGIGTCAHLSTPVYTAPCPSVPAARGEARRPALRVPASLTARSTPHLRSGRSCIFSCALVKITHHAFLCQTGSPDAGLSLQQQGGAWAPSPRGAWPCFPRTPGRQVGEGTRPRSPGLRCQICLRSWLQLKLRRPPDSHASAHPQLLTV